MKGFKKKSLVVLCVVALIATIGVTAAIYVYQPSNDLTLRENAPAPTQITTVLTSDKASGEFNSGESVTLIATLSQPIGGVNVAFQELVGGVLTPPAYAVTNAHGVASFTFTPSPVDTTTDRVFRATPQG